jgi:Basic region leucine zipper
MPSSLRGLNLVHPPRSPTASQDLLAPHPDLPDVTAQLDIWTHLNFASEEPEPLINTRRKERETAAHLHSKPLDLKEADEMNQIAHRDLATIADKQLQTPADTSTPSILSEHHSLLQGHGSSGSFDLGSFLAGFGIDPFLVPPQPDTEYSPLSSLSEPSFSALPSPNNVSLHSRSPPDDDTLPPLKRSRNRKDSIASQAPAVVVPVAVKKAEASSARADSEFSDDHDPLTTPLTAAEDKRRRNTAASARFRAKKKEREQALERRSKELETRVNELERECEGLRRENGWLKGLVVGVTGGNASGMSKTLAEDEPERQDGNKKRKRDTDSGAVNS